MKWMIASDIHGSAAACRRLLDALRREQADRLLLLGDLLYHGPRNPLPEEYDPPQVAELLNGLTPSPLCVRGNCDAEVDQLLFHFPILADYALLDWNGILVYATHGHHLDETPLPLTDGDLLLAGHTHVSACRRNGTYWYANPGSISLPKEDTPRGYMLLDGSYAVWKTLDSAEYRRQKLIAD